MYSLCNQVHFLFLIGATLALLHVHELILTFFFSAHHKSSDSSPCFLRCSRNVNLNHQTRTVENFFNLVALQQQQPPLTYALFIICYKKIRRTCLTEHYPISYVSAGIHSLNISFSLDIYFKFAGKYIMIIYFSVKTFAR